jgi:hypothetical protein
VVRPGVRCSRRLGLISCTPKKHNKILTGQPTGWPIHRPCCQC